MPAHIPSAHTEDSDSMLTYERGLWDAVIQAVAGGDEVGRGPLAGPVVAAAVVFKPGVWIDGVDDSKKLSARQRESLFNVIRQSAAAVGLGIVERETIDQINILQATYQAMREAVTQIGPTVEHILVDGHAIPDCPISQTAIVRGDQTSFSIAAASIIAKVTRDRIMVQLDRQYPQYGFTQHKGYPTRSHVEALREFGPCDAHRRSFRVKGW